MATDTIISTATVVDSIQAELDKGNANTVADAAQQMKLGTMLTPLKRTFTGLTSGTTFDLTAIDGTGETAGTANTKRLAALDIATLRITAGAANHVPCVVTDVGGTPTDTATLSVATLSDDGKTIVFGAAVTGFVVEYIPRSAKDMTSAFYKAS